MNCGYYMTGKSKTGGNSLLEQFRSGNRYLIANDC